MLNRIFKKEKAPTQERELRDLLRENLNLITVDMFYKEDPIIKLKKEERILYLKKFSDLSKDGKLIERIKYHINKQAQMTLAAAKDGTQDVAGSMNINGLAFVIDEIERLAKQYVKETTKKPETPLSKFDIIPKVG